MRLKFLLLTCIVTSVFSCKEKAVYKYDGVYEGRSQEKYADEPFVGISCITIVKGKIEKMDFRIIDTSKNEIFDNTYEKYFIGNDEYINQCRNDWKGVIYYQDRLLKTQRLDRVDAVSGATWSYNLFKSSTSIAMRKASSR